MRLRALVMAMLASTGCLASSYRYLDVDGPPGRALALTEEAARAQGFAVIDAGPCEAMACGPLVASLQRAGLPLPDGGALEEGYSLTAVVPRAGGERVELEPFFATRPELLAVPAARSTVLVPEAGESGWVDALVVDGELALLAARDPARDGLTWRLNVAGQLGPRLVRFEPESDVTHVRHSLSLLLGGGVKVGPTGPALMPELTLSLDRQLVIAPVPGRVLPVGRRWAVDLTVAGLFLDNEQQVPGSTALAHRTALEGALTLRRADLGGFTLRAGRAWGNGGGFEGAVGIRVLEPVQALEVGVLGGGVAALLYLLVTNPPSLGPPSKG
jgi:hypothetical protein